jgi:hypothetical protein
LRGALLRNTGVEAGGGEPSETTKTSAPISAAAAAEIQALLARASATARKPG